MSFMARQPGWAGELDAYLAAAYDPVNIDIFPEEPIAGIRLNSSGIVEISETTASWTAADTWLLVGLNSDFECRWTTDTGTLTSGTEATWEALSSTRTWTKQKTGGVGSVSVTGTLEIRRASDGVVVATAAVSITATITA